MGVIINIDEALKLHAQYNILKEPLNDMLRNQQEMWETNNPIDLLFTRNSISTFQETYTSSIGFAHAFAETSDYAVGPIFNTANGFTATYRTRTFQGSFIITKQVLEDMQMGTVKDDASAFMRRWNGEIVEYAMAAISSGFGKEVTWGSEENGGVSRLKLMSADTVDGDVTNTTKNPLFFKDHTIVKRGKETVLKQSNIFYADINLADNPAVSIAKLAYLINEVITIMENYKDDNGKRVASYGAKTIVAPNHALLKACLNTALSSETFCEINGGGGGINPAYNRATVATTPYLLDIPQCADGLGFFIVDKEYNAANHGPEFTERIPLTMEVIEQKRPYGIIYDARQRFDINVASWRGIAYVHIGKPTGSGGDWNDPAKYTEITVSTIAKPVAIVGEVTTKAAE